MKAAGIIRNVDELGRVVIPKSLRKRFGFEYQSPIEIFADDNGVYLQKYEPVCFFCKSPEMVLTFENKKICQKCLEKLQK